MSEDSHNWGAKDAKSINPDRLAPLAPLATSQSTARRDTKGRFLTGNSGGGRKKGSRNRLTEAVLTALERDFAIHGPDVLAALRSSDPATYLRIVASLIPRDTPDEEAAVAQTDCCELEQFDELLFQERLKYMIDRIERRLIR